MTRLLDRVNRVLACSSWSGLKSPVICDLARTRPVSVPDHVSTAPCLVVPTVQLLSRSRQWTIPHWGTQTKAVCSDYLESDGQTWWLCLYPQGYKFLQRHKVPHLMVFLEVPDALKADPCKSVHPSVKIAVVNPLDPSTQQSQATQHTLEQSDPKFFTAFVPLYHLQEPYIAGDGSLKLQVDVDLHGPAAVADLHGPAAVADMHGPAAVAEPGSHLSTNLSAATTDASARADNNVGQGNGDNDNAACASAAAAATVAATTATLKNGQSLPNAAAQLVQARLAALALAPEDAASDLRELRCTLRFLADATGGAVPVALGADIIASASRASHARSVAAASGRAVAAAREARGAAIAACADAEAECAEAVAAAAAANTAMAAAARSAGQALARAMVGFQPK